MDYVLNNRIVYREGEYNTRGDYHKYLDPNWPYYPIYIRKQRFVRKYIKKNAIPSDKILDIGCGEGVLVEEFRSKGYDIYGMDLNYASDVVQRGDVRYIPFKNESFKYVLCLDVIEHLDLRDQDGALREIYRVLIGGGEVILTIPNMAHLYSRLTRLVTGRYLRTASIKKHPGDRPIKEHLALLPQVGFKVRKRYGIKLTLPPILDKALQIMLPKVWYMNYIYDQRYPPGLCFLNTIIAEKDDKGGS